MTWHAARNFATTTASSGALNNTTSPITFSVTDGSVFGSTFPMWAVIDPSGTPELIEITSRSGNSITATRASASAHTGSPTVACTVAADYIDELQDAVDLKSPIASPALTGVPTAPTPAPGTNTTQIATTAFVQAASGGGGGLSEYAIMKATTQQALSGGNFTAINFPTVLEDTSTLTDTANQFTIATAGVYSVSFFVGVSGATQSRLQAAISVNGAAFSNDGAVQTITSSKLARSVSEYWAVSCAGIVSLDEGDEVFAYLYSSDSDNTSNASCDDVPFAYFSIAKIS